MSKLVSIGLLAALLFAGFAVAGAKEKTAAKKKVPALHAATGEIIDRVLGAKKGLKLGMSVSRIPREAPGAAIVLDEYFLPLEGSSFAPKGDWQGTIYLPGLIEDEGLSEIRICLLAGKYDRKALLAYLKGKVREAGVEDFLRDEEGGDWTWWGTDDEDRDLWIGLGEKIVVLAFMAP